MKSPDGSDLVAPAASLRLSVGFGRGTEEFPTGFPTKFGEEVRNADAFAAQILLSLPASPTAVEIAAWIGGLFFLVAGWNQVERFFDRRTQRSAAREILPQPLAVAKVDGPVPESLCRSRHEEVSHELERLEQEVGALRQERRAEVFELQQKLNKVDREVGELRASIDLNNQHLTRIDAKLDRVIERQNDL